jgi:voltage-gated potassium channel
MAETAHSKRQRLHRIIFGTDTFAGRLFDIALIVFIIGSILVVMLDSVHSIHSKYTNLLKFLEWFFTIIFTIEYLTRLYVVQSPKKYALSFFGIIDLISIIPTYLSLLIVNSHYLLVIRSLRLLRIFRILKLVQYLNQADVLIAALKASRTKITIFMFTVINLVIILGTIMYVVEDEASGFSSIPKSIYWAIVTLTTVGYGDISPKTPLGQFIASVVMIIGYAIIAVPTGIVTMELNKASTQNRTYIACTNCGADIIDRDANFCKYCGAKLEED